MSYLMEMGRVPAPGLGTIVLLGGSFRASRYSVRIGLVRIEMSRQWDTLYVDGYHQFLDFPQAFIDESQESLFDLGPAPSIVSTKAVEFTQAEEFASGPSWQLLSSDLKIMLRTILPEHNGSVTVLQFMLNRHAHAMHLTGPQSTDYYASVVYDDIGGPLAQEKKADCL